MTASLALHAFPDEEEQAQRLADRLGLTAGLIRRRQFPDGETLISIPPAGARQIVYRSLDRPNEKLVDLVLAAEAWRRGGARELILIAPYLCYMRQDAVFAEGQAVSQTAVGGLLGSLFDRIITVDAHLHRTQSMSCVVAPAGAVNLSSASCLAAELSRTMGTDTLVLGPDRESEPWVESVAARLGAESAVFAKTRLADASVDLTPPANVRLAGREIIIVDDICSTGGSLLAMVGMLRSAGASRIGIAVTHALCPMRTVTALLSAGAESFISSDSVAHETNRIRLDSLLAAAIDGRTPS
jgi:ribose-phosphate pyrophosphokinase